MEAIEPVLTPDGWRRIPTSDQDALIDAQLVTQGAAAMRVRCPVCAVAHFERVIERSEPDGTVRHYIKCPREMRVQIREDDRQTWRVDVAKFARTLSESASLVGDVRSLGSDRVYYCGHYVYREIRIDVYLARGLGRKDGASVASCIPNGPFAPIVFVPRDVPSEVIWPGLVPIVIPLCSTARFEADAFGLDLRVLEQAAMRLIESKGGAPYQFLRRGDFWDLAFKGSEIIHLADSVGLAYLARLLSEPHQAIPAVTLLASRAGIDSRIPTGSSGEAIDPEGMRKLREQYRELLEEQEKAKAVHDAARIDKARAESDELTVELNRRLGKGGKVREATDVDRVRRAVSTAVKRDIERIYKNLPDFGNHLRTAVTTGLLLKYSPDHDIDWIL